MTTTQLTAAQSQILNQFGVKPKSEYKHEEGVRRGPLTVFPCFETEPTPDQPNRFLSIKQERFSMIEEGAPIFLVARLADPDAPAPAPGRYAEPLATFRSAEPIGHWSPERANEFGDVAMQSLKALQNGTASFADTEAWIALD